MVKLYDAEASAPIGEITEGQLQFMIDNLEETTSDDQDYWIDIPTLAMLRSGGADEEQVGDPAVREAAYNVKKQLIDLAAVSGCDAVKFCKRNLKTEMTREAARELAAYNIRVNAVCPGIVDTPLTRQIHSDRGHLAGVSQEESLAHKVSQIPLGRIETPEDVAGVVAFLVSPDGAYITGQTISVSGGLTMHG